VSRSGRRSRVAPQARGHWLAAGVSAAILELAVTAGLRSSLTSLGPLIAVESLSARFSGALLALGTAAPLGYALSREWSRR
jgi:hypothetical protein